MDEWRRRVALRDGTQVVLRLVKPTDKALLLKGLEKLSPESRYRRFLMPKVTLSDRELSYLTELDGWDHFALGAVREIDDGTEEGLGVARFVRLDGEPHVAEAAVAVIDEMQGKGLGRLLLQELAAAARERGITHFRSLLLAANAPMRSLFTGIAERPVKTHLESGAIELDVPISADPSVPPPPPGGVADLTTALEHIFEAAASGAVTVLRLFGIPRDP